MIQRWYATRWFAVLVALGAAVANGVWVLLDRTSPSWDQSSYLSLGLYYDSVVGADGLGALPAAMQAADPSRGPLYVLLLMPAMAVFGGAPATALSLNAVLAPVAYLAAGEIAYNVFRSWLARLVAIVVMAGTPLLVGLQHDVLVDFLLVTITCLSVMFLVKSHVFERRSMTVMMGVLLALGTLTKVTFPVFVVGPIVVAAVRLVVMAVRRQGTGTVRRFANVALALLVYVALIAVWYVPNFEATRAYVKSTTGGALSVGAGPEDPLTWTNLVAFAVQVVNDHLSWPLLLICVGVLLLHVPTLVSWFSRGTPAQTWFDAVAIGSWIVVPYVVLATGSNQDVRLMAPAFAGVAVAVGGGLATLRAPALRAAMIAVTVAVLGFQTFNRVVPVGEAVLPAGVTVAVGGHTLRAPIGSSVPIGYLRLPRRDRATPIYSWIDQRAETAPDGAHTGVVCFLVTYPFVNTNTFRYLNAYHDDTFEMRDVLIGPGGLPELRAALDQCDFAIYDDLRARGDSGQVRLDFVNEAYAANHVTARMLRVFDGPSQKFWVGDASRAPSEAWPKDTWRVTVLSQRPSGQN